MTYKFDLENYDGDLISDCCGAEMIYNDQLCGDCKEHAEAIPEDADTEQLNAAFTAYLEDNPDFEAALNGHPDYIQEEICLTLL